MITGIIIIIISLLLDGLLTNFFPYVGSLSIFTPLLTVVTISVIYPLFRKQENKYLLTLFITGIIYDLLYTNLYFIDGVIFFIIGIISIKLYKYLEIDNFKILLLSTIVIIVYELLLFFIIFIFRMTDVSLFKLLYKITHTILLNILYGEIIYVILTLLPNNYKKISIN